MENIEIETTQNVDIQYNIASIGDRVVAQIIDLLVEFVVGIFKCGLSIRWIPR